jgi:hypothetical protein
VEANIILANGTSNPDLFWALRGAGHNFRIVSEFRQKIYDQDTQEKWLAREYFFSHDKFEVLVRVMNSLTNQGTKSYLVELGTFITYMRAPKKDSTNVKIF